MNNEYKSVRNDAKAAGDRFYRTGRPCKNGHKGLRYSSTGGCVDCVDAKNTANYADPERKQACIDRATALYHKKKHNKEWLASRNKQKRESKNLNK